MFVGLLWLISNHMFASGNFLDKYPSQFFKNLKFSEMHSGDLSQIALPNMRLLVLIELIMVQ